MVIENLLFWIAILALISVISTKLSDKFAVPVLLLFLAIGILAGSEGLGRVYFNDPWMAKSIGVIALAFIIFSGGIDTKWKEIQPVLLPGILLSTLGVLLTAIIVGGFAVFILKYSFIEGLLLGSIVSSTDAAAVFSILRSKRISLKSPLKPLLELESGSNDPMAVFLTLTCINILTLKDYNTYFLIPRFILDMVGGALIGYLMARFIVLIINKLKLEFDGLYPVLTVAFVLLTYSLATILKCNGFMAVYIAGLIMGRQIFINKTMIMRFHDGLAWLMQITMFLVLGLLVFPSRILPITLIGLLLVALLMFIARPISVFISLLPFKMSARKKTMIAWVGLRGAAPIILATFPLLAGVNQAESIFNIVFFVVVASVLIQGASIPLFSKMLKVDAPLAKKQRYPIEFERREGIDAELHDVIVPYDSASVGKRIADLGIPEKCLIMLISRDDKFIIPAGPTVIDGGDVLLVLANEQDLVALNRILLPFKAD
ncbi:MAG: potassium/proton antiporter [Candidatus Omnitrophica bacterium]|nr:potassium/proton antiporter [Candidatus Omnitrophota bacterium]